MAVYSLDAVLAYTFIFLAGLAGVIALFAVATAGRSCRARVRELEEELEYLQKRVAQLKRERVELAAKAAELKPEAVRLLDAVMKGEVVLKCRNGKVANIMGGEIVCMDGEEEVD